MSNIEHLKKRAKALVRLHRERSYHLACVARETLPKFAKMSDREILSADFKLSDAQTLVARHEGTDELPFPAHDAQTTSTMIEPKSVAAE